MISAEDFRDQVGSTTWAVDRDQTFIELPSEIMNSTAMVAGMEVTYGLSDIVFHSSRVIWLQLLLNAQYAENNSAFPVWHHFPGRSACDLVLH